MESINLPQILNLREVIDTALVMNTALLQKIKASFRSQVIYETIGGENPGGEKLAFLARVGQGGHHRLDSRW